MNKTNNRVSQGENLLNEAEHALQHDDGRRWPPPPTPPSDKTKWAKDNSSAVDPFDEASIKEYAFATVPMLPVFHTVQFPQRRSAEIVSMLQSNPENSWIPRHEGLLSRAYLRTERQHSELEIPGEHQLFGIRCFVKRLDGTTFVKWQSGVDPGPDRRDMSHAQRLAEDRLLKFRCLAWPLLDEILDQANALSKFVAKFRELGLEKMIESQIFEDYAVDVAVPLRRIQRCIKRFNQLGRHLYKLPERRLPMEGAGSLSDWDFVFHYPWCYPREIWCSLLLRLLEDPEIRSRSFRKLLSERGFPDLSRSAIILAHYCAKYESQAHSEVV